MKTFICVRKTIFEKVLIEIKNFLHKDTIIVSVVAGASIKSIREMLSENKIVRIMPNISISINQGIIGTYKSTIDLDRFLSDLGTVFKVKNESVLDVFTVAGGCGPGIVAYLMQSLTTSFIEIGIEQKIASGMVIKTLHGTLNILVESKITSEQLLSQVATKGGITESIVDFFDEKKLKIIIANGLQKGMQKLLKK